MKGKVTKVITPKISGWLEYELSDKELDYVWRCVDNKKEDHRDHLAGHVSGSYRLMDRSDWFWLNVIKPLMLQYHEFFENLGYSTVTLKHPYNMDDWWVNYQRENEFNPVHFHGGVYSFVIWLKIPTSYKEQRKLSFANKSNNPVISNFVFEYLNTLGDTRHHIYEMSPNSEGKMLFFPAKLNHMVYPFFNCNEERISVSGNITINTSKLIK